MIDISKDFNHISYDDDKFPKELTKKIEHLEIYFEKYYKCRQYNIWFNVILNRVEINFLFDYKTINIAIDYDYIFHEKVSEIFRLTKYLIEKEYKKIWWKEDTI